jgi:hypothetical protein
MPLNTVFSWVIKKRIHQIELFRKYPVEVQREVLADLLLFADETEFGKEYGFKTIKSAAEFASRVPVRTYEEYSLYIDQVVNGKQNLLWPTRMRWFAKSSGTTSGRSKYIPVSKEALEDCHYKGGKDLLALYYHLNPNADLYGGKHLILGGSSSIMSHSSDSYIGDLSAIILRNLPFWVELKRTPSMDIALMDNWEEKIEQMALQTMNEDVRMVAGVPSWTLVLFKRILEIKKAAHIRQVWPKLELFMHGGVSFKPYRQQFRQLIPGSGMHYFETYNASEGFFGIQDRIGSDDMLLMLDYGIYYEFMPVEEIGKSQPQTLSLREVEIGINYALIITTNGGLWRYMPGDTIRFTSLAPYRIQVSGRTKSFINAFGEELIVENADEAIKRACEASGAIIAEYTAGPVYMNEGSTGAHEWLVEFEVRPEDFNRFTEVLDKSLRELNSDYDAKRTADLTLRFPIVRELEKGTFLNWFRRKGKMGGQHKMPRLSNNRELLEDVLQLMRSEA